MSRYSSSIVVVSKSLETGICDFEKFAEFLPVLFKEDSAMISASQVPFQTAATMSLKANTVTPMISPHSADSSYSETGGVGDDRAPGG